MTDISLSAASRSNLLSLQNTQSLVNRTQNRLSTGKAVSSVVDDAIKYFQGKGLSDRATDLSARKDSIDQAISAVKVVTETTTQMEKLVKQMKGLVDTSRSATASVRKENNKQIGEIAKQIQKLVNDASYSGQNLVNATQSKLTVYFSDKSDSKLDVQGVNFNSSAFFLNSQGAAAAVEAVTTVSEVATQLAAGGFTGALSAYTLSIAGNLASFNVRANNVIAALDKTVDNLRAKAGVFGNAVAVLQVRLDFTKNYTNLLSEGSDKLTLADLNEEGANLLALQTRQQLGIQALSFAGQSEQAVLRLFQ